MQLASAVIGNAADADNGVWIGDLERRSGLYLLGKSGTGKTVLMVNLLDQDIQHGHGIFF